MVDADREALCQAIFEGIEAGDWEEWYEHYREMRRAAGVGKANESQVARAFWKMKVANDRRKDFL